MVLKKYQVPGTVPSGKPPKSEPYRTVPCRTMQWKSAICFLLFKNVLLGEIHFDGKISIKVKFEDVQIANITFSRQLLGSNNVLIWHFFRDTRQLASN